jgi:hypothetical protein
VRACATCQRNKSEHLHLVGLLQLLEVLSVVWADIAMHFIQGFPKVNGKSVILTVVDRFVTLSFKAKTKCILLCVPGSSFTHKATNSEINSISSVYYIESYYKTYYKTKRSKQQKQAPRRRQMTGGPHT